MPKDQSPETVRSLFTVADIEEVAPERPEAEIEDRQNEARRVNKRIQKIIEEHREASAQIGVEIGPDETRTIIAGLRDHAKGGPGTLDLTGSDEIKAHCLNRLLEELIEEPSNILYTTPTSPETIRYDAMDSGFWIECLDLLEKNLPDQK